MNEKEFNEVKKIVQSATNFVRKFPFYYAALYVMLIVCYLFCSDSVSELLDITFYVSPFVVFVSLRFSRIFRFCIWHRMECLLPLIPYVFNIADCIYPLGVFGSVANLINLITIFFLSIVNAYFVFRKSR